VELLQSVRKQIRSVYNSIKGKNVTETPTPDETEVPAESDAPVDSGEQTESAPGEEVDSSGNEPAPGAEGALDQVSDEGEAAEE
jgi:hypothetical protein